MSALDLFWWSLSITFAAFLALGFLAIVAVAVGAGIAEVAKWADKRKAAGRVLAGKESDR